MNKKTLLELLRQGRYVSGAELAGALRLSRTAVWKAVEQLRREGYPIDSIPRRGHRLSSGSDVLSAEGIRRYLSHSELSLRYFPTITSTNTVLKALAAENAPAPLALVAGEQTAGRGRLGRSFYSPPESGLYLSLLLRPDLEAADATRLTACAAVATAEAIRELSGIRPDIKWVNDLLIRGRKVCGILTEAGLNLETGRMDYVVIGIGINTRIPAREFPEEIRETAGAVFGSDPVPDLRNRLAASILDHLLDDSTDPASEEVFRKYRDASLAPGQPIRILSPGREPVPAQALELERDFSLRVRLEDGSEQLLRSGEISIRLS